jgi:Protein of unknown function (DUF3618)
VRHGEANEPVAGVSGRLAAVPAARDPRQIQLEIDAARESLAATLDHLVYRGSPKRVAETGREAAVRFLQTPAGMAVVGGVGVLLSLAVVQRIRHRKR